jgi:hypothetical protein
MEEMNHTPEPWEAHWDGEWQTWDRDADGISRRICVLHGLFGRREANARLIDAAPELLEVCETLVDITSYPSLDLDAMSDLIDRAKVAIARAKGEEPWGR